MKNLIVIVLLFIAQFSFGQGNIKEIDLLLNSLYQKGRINGNVLIADKGKVVYNRSFGLANEGTLESLNENYAFDLASVTKQFTAAGIVILNERGKLTLDDPISKHIAELSFYEGVTIRHLLHHTGGLPDYMDLFGAVLDKPEIITNDDIVNFFSTKRPTVAFVPGTKWRYSNTGYALLATIIERVSGKKYGDFLALNIFNPLNMTNTFVYQRRFLPQETQNYAYAYVYSDSLNALVLPDELEEYSYARLFDGVVGDGGLSSSVLDLLKWDRALYTNKLISAEGRKEMFSPAILADGSSFDYGFGWDLSSSLEFGKVVSHAGGWAGYRTFFERHIDNDKTIVILFNHKDSEVIHTAIRYLLYGLPIPNPTNKTEITLTGEQLQNVLGMYRVREGVEFTLSLKGGDPYAQMTGQPPLRIYAESETSFFLKEFEATIQIIMDKSGKANKLVVSQGKNRLEADKVK